jgi:hypothetical protein
MRSAMNDLLALGQILIDYGSFYNNRPGVLYAR